MTVSSQLERTNDRSFQIAGQYPITPGTLGPVSCSISRACWTDDQPQTLFTDQSDCSTWPIYRPVLC